MTISTLKLEDKQAYYDQNFDGLVYIESTFTGLEFERCVFTNCNFQGSTFLDCYFSDCIFLRSNLSLLKPTKSKLDNVLFKESKVVGVNWVKSQIHEFSTFNFESSVLDMNIFYGMKLQKMKIFNSQAHDVDFVSADLSNADIRGTDLTNASFSNTNLNQTDFRGATNYNIDVTINKLKKTRFSSDQAIRLLDSLNIILD